MMDAADDTTAPDVQVAVEGRIGHITLNRPKAINALDLGMVEAVDAALARWADDDEVEIVVLDGAGKRGFCAGGDIRMFRESALAGDGRAVAFWRAEYRLDARIARYRKPVVAIMDGIVMGGGIGLGGHAHHRVATTRLRAAMPEVGIGYFPDAGARRLLVEAPGHCGTHLALTGTTIGAADALHCGLADVVIDRAGVPELLVRLATLDPDQAIARVADTPERSALAHAQPWIDACYDGSSPWVIVEALERHGAADAAAAAALIRTRSPTALAVTLRALRRAADLSLEACLEEDLRISRAFLTTPDFVEGIRAAVVDKDRDPHWAPAQLDAVDRQATDRYFAAAPD